MSSGTIFAAPVDHYEGRPGTHNGTVCVCGWSAGCHGDGVCVCVCLITRGRGREEEGPPHLSNSGQSGVATQSCIMTPLFVSLVGGLGMMGGVEE